MSIDTKALKERIYALEADLGTAQHADHEETIRALVVAADRLSELEAARHAYASEFPLNAEGEPDVSNIHQNIRALKQRLAALEAELASAREAERDAAQAEVRELKQRIDIMLCQACHDRCNTPPTGLFHSPDPEEEPCIICWLEQQSDETVKHAERADKAEAEARELRERAEKAERNYQWMVERAADQHLSGYRELARRAADAENVADGLRAELARVRELCPEVIAFAHLMQHKLNMNAHKDGEGWGRDSSGKRGWKSCSPQFLMDKLHEEALELTGAIHAGDSAKSIRQEAADVGNIAMMLADVCGALSQPAERESGQEGQGDA